MDIIWIFNPLWGWSLCTELIVCGNTRSVLDLAKKSWRLLYYIQSFQIIPPASWQQCRRRWQGINFTKHFTDNFFVQKVLSLFFPNYTVWLCNFLSKEYRNDRLNNLFSLSPSLCTNGLSYSGEETRPSCCYTEYKAFGPSLIYNKNNGTKAANKMLVKLTKGWTRPENVHDRRLSLHRTLRRWKGWVILQSCQ